MIVSGQEAQNAPGAMAFEFVVGVTGHRDGVPEHIPAQKAAIADALKGLIGRFDKMPLKLVTGLAEGADTIAAEVALDMGIDVLAVLPMPKEIYEGDFEGKTLQKFRKLTENQRVQTIELPLIKQRSANDMSVQSHRDDQYDLLKNYLVRRSNVLLALWDGEVSLLRGGTSDVVLSYLSGEDGAPPPTAIPAHKSGMDDCGQLAIWIKMPRRLGKNGEASTAYSFLVSNSTGVAYSESATIPTQFFDRWSGLESYASNRFSSTKTDLPVYRLADHDDACITDDARALEREFMRADQLAMANQLLSDRLFIIFGLIAGAMGLFFLIYAKLAALKVFLVVYVALFLVGYIVFRIGLRNRWLGHHLAYRSLAETLRVQFFLLASGAGRGFSARRILNMTSVDRFEHFEWLIDAVRCAEPLFYADNRENERLESVQVQWIDDQANYFSRKLESMHTQHERLGVVKSILLAGSLLGAVVLIFFYKSLVNMDIGGFDGKSSLVFCMGILPLWLAVWELFQGKMATRELIWQYANQRRYFVAARHQILNAPDITSKRRVVSDLAEQALVEIYLWSVHRYHREHEPPAAG